MLQYLQPVLKLFVDLDGVLVDFDRGVKNLTGRNPTDLPVRTMWSKLARTPRFYELLEWTADGPLLWDFVSRFEPTILTGLPMGGWAEPQKRAWCARELGPAVPVIACMSRDKARRGLETTPKGWRAVLIDDRARLQSSWEEAGGVFILHTDAASSVQAVAKLWGVPAHSIPEPLRRTFSGDSTCSSSME